MATGSFRRATLAQIDSNIPRVLEAQAVKVPPSQRRMTQGPSGRLSFGRRSSFSASRRMSTGLVAPTLSFGGPSGASSSGVGGAASMGGASSSSTASAASSSRRLSGVNRLSSVYTEAPLSKVADPRPIQSKDFQRDAKMLLIKFLSENGYSCTLSLGLLKQPTAKDFATIFQFLFNKLHPTYKWANGQIPFEVEITNLLDRLRYPFKINKSVLQSPGSPHSWPVLLAMLVWLVNLIETLDEVVADPLGDMDDSERLFYEFVRRGYDRFLQGDDSPSDLDGELKANLDQKRSLLTSEISLLETNKATLKAELDGLRSQEAPCVAAARQRAAVVEDLANFTAYMDKRRKQLVDTQKALTTVNAEYKRSQEELASVVAEKASVQKILDAQELSPVDVERLKLEAERLTRELDTLSAQKDELSRSKWEGEIAISKALDSLEARTIEYNALIDDAAACGIKIPKSMRAVLNSKAAEPASILPLDRSAIKNALMSAKTQFSQDLHESQTALLEAQEAHERTCEAARERDDEASALEAKVKRMEEDTRVVKNVWTEKAAAVDSEIAREEEAIASLRTNCSDGVASSEQRLAAVRQDISELMKRVDREHRNLKGLLRQTADMLTRHKEYVSSVLRTELGSATAIYRDIATK